MREVFATFDEVVYPPLKVYNRMVTAFNIMEDYGPQQLDIYYNNFNEKERSDIIDMMKFTKANGRDYTLKMILRNHEPELDDNHV